MNIISKKKKAAKPSKLFIADQRMLELMEYSISSGISKNQKDWCTAIGFNPTNLPPIRSGKRGFTDEHKLAAAKLLRANMNWIFGLDENMLRMDEKSSATDLIKAGLRLLEKK